MGIIFGYFRPGARACIRRIMRSRGLETGCSLVQRAQAALIIGTALAGLASLPPAKAQALTGTWEFSADHGTAKCRISLRSELAAPGRQQVTVPLACLQPFPVLGPVESWNLQGDHLAFAGRSGQAILDFVAKPGAYIATGPNGETYRLAAMGGRAEETPPPIPQQNKPQPAATVVSTAKVQAEAAGRYSVLREGGKDTGCMLTLDAKGASQRRGKASLAPGCRDQGIVIFDPAGWDITDGRLVLTARKGHKAHFDARPDGSWEKDPAEGSPLSLKKL
jgi:Protease inhibitor Inh